MLTIAGPSAPEPLYSQLVGAIAGAIDGGELAPGARLPTQRELARTMGLAITTVTRAYAEAERRGLIRCDVGRGSFVRASEGPADGAGLDLRTNALLPWAFDSELRAAMQRSLGRDSSANLFGYGPPAGALHHRAAAAQFLRQTGLAEASAERTLLTAGAQHAMAVALLALAEPGDVVLTEAFTYPGIKQLADALRLRLVPVAMDRHGLLPDALRKAARQHRARILYAVPTLQNPTSAVLTRARARALAAVVSDLGIRLLEDDSYGFLMPEAPRLAPLLPGAVVLTGPSKALAPGVRFGVLHAPLDLVPRFENAIAATANCASPLACELVSDWIRDGIAERVMAWKRQEVAARQQVVAEALAGLTVQTHPMSPHLWIPLPAPWTAHRFVSQAAARGVLVSPAERFAVGSDDTAAIRVCLGPPATREALRKAITTLGDLLRQGPGSAHPLA